MLNTKSQRVWRQEGRSLVSLSPPYFPLKTHLRNCSSSSVWVLHEQVVPSLTLLSTASLARHLPTSVLIDDRRIENKRLLCADADTAFQQTLDRRQVAMALSPSSREGNNYDDRDQFINEFQQQLLHRPELWPSLQRKEKSFSMTSESISSESEKLTGVEADRAVALAREAFSDCREAASIAKGAEVFGAHLDGSSSIRGSASAPAQRTVRSTRLLERQTKRRRVTKAKVELHYTKRFKMPRSHRKLDGGDPKVAVRRFLWGPETVQLLTAKEESDIIAEIQELMKVDEVKSRLQTKLSRQPTLLEWAKAVGTSCQALRLQVYRGNISRHRIINANKRMVVHIAKRYQGQGLSLPDLLQEGSLGLMMSIEKFKPDKGCRFAFYAYWWIRASITKAIYQHSRLIRLPESFYVLLRKVDEAKRVCIQQGNPDPTDEDIAVRAGISVEKLEKLLFSAREPISLQQTAHWDIVDTTIEDPEVTISKQMMRQQVRNLLSILNPRERKIIWLRFGIEDGRRRRLSEIGDGLGLTRERVRQLESQSLDKLRLCARSQGLEAYAYLLI